MFLVMYLCGQLFWVAGLCLPQLAVVVVVVVVCFDLVVVHVEWVVEQYFVLVVVHVELVVVQYFAHACLLVSEVAAVDDARCEVEMAYVVRVFVAEAELHMLVVHVFVVVVHVTAA